MYDPAPPGLAWWRPEDTPADLDGPGDLPFEPPGRAMLDRPVFDLVEAAADRWPEAVALRDDARILRYPELRDATWRLAMRVAGATPRGTAVAVWLANGLDAAVALLACCAAGRPCLLLNADFPPERVRAILRDAAAAGIILARPASLPDLPDGVVPIVPDAPAAPRAKATRWRSIRSGRTKRRWRSTPPAAPGSRKVSSVRIDRPCISVGRRCIASTCAPRIG